MNDVRTIQDLQSEGLESPFAGEHMNRRVSGVVTHQTELVLRGENRRPRRVKAVTVQMPERDAQDSDASKAIVVVLPRGQSETPALGSEVSFRGKVSEINELSRSPFDATTTAVFADSLTTEAPGVESDRKDDALELITARGVKPVEWNAEHFHALIEARLATKGIENTPKNYRAEQRLVLSSLESSLFVFPAGSKLAAPSNPFGDYVFVPADTKRPTTIHGAPLADADWIERSKANIGLTVGYAGRAAALRARGEGYNAYPSGSSLQEGVWGALRVRVGAPQVDVAMNRMPVKGAAQAELKPAELGADPKKDLVVLSLNAFNFNAHIEDVNNVKHPRDVTDAIGEGRHLRLVDAILRSDSLPGIIALQEMQKDDGVELTDTMTAEKTYEALLAPLRERTGKDYGFKYFMEPWEKSGGQPGGNIHLGFAWDPDVVTPIGDPYPLGLDTPSMVNSRKPLAQAFRHNGTGEVTVVVNVHNTSLRNGRSIVAKANPGEDPRTPLRVEQNRTIAEFVSSLETAGISYQVVGDFNDTEFSESLKALEEDASIIEPDNGDEQADYNHRGLAQNLSHIVTSTSDADRTSAVTTYDEQSHGVPMGSLSGGRSTDHGLLWSKRRMKAQNRRDEEVLEAMSRAAERADAFAAGTVERAKTDIRLLVGLSFTLDSADWLELAQPVALDRPQDFVDVIGLVKTPALQKLLKDRDVAGALLAAAEESGDALVAGVIQNGGEQKRS
ncbi:MAG: hypothetical protein AAF654_02980 [Myxococcota bacterium]